MHNLVYIGLGSNIDPLTNLAKIPAFFPAARYSSIYISPSFLQDGQPDYYNQVLEWQTDLDFSQLLNKLQYVEKAIGRIHRYVWGPREIDCDLLLYNRTILKTPSLTIPHPGLKYRATVILPLLELNPNLILPDNTPLAECAQQCDNANCRILHKKDLHDALDAQRKNTALQPA